MSSFSRLSNHTHITLKAPHSTRSLLIIAEDLGDSTKHKLFSVTFYKRLKVARKKNSEKTIYLLEYLTNRPASGETNRPQEWTMVTTIDLVYFALSLPLERTPFPLEQAHHRGWANTSSKPQEVTGPKAGR